MIKNSTLKIVIIILSIVVVLFVSAVLAYKPIKTMYRDKMYPKQYTEIVEKYSSIYGIEENFLYAIIKTESSFNPDAVSVDNAKGLMQVTEETFEWLSTKMDNTDDLVHDDLHIPEIGVMYGSFFIDYLLKEFGKKEVVLAAYHAGRGITNKWLQDEKFSDDQETLKEIPYSSTAHYVDKVMDNYENYNKLYD